MNTWSLDDWSLNDYQYIFVANELDGQSDLQEDVIKDQEGDLDQVYGHLGEDNLAMQQVNDDEVDIAMNEQDGGYINEHTDLVDTMLNNEPTE